MEIRGFMRVPVSTSSWNARVAIDTPFPGRTLRVRRRATCGAYPAPDCSLHCTLLILQKPVGDGIALVKSMVPDVVLIMLLVVQTPEIKLEDASRTY